MKDIIQIQIPMFQACLWVFFGSAEECVEAQIRAGAEEAAAKKWKKDYYDGIHGAECHGMYSFDAEYNISLLWLPKVPETIREYGSLVHELEHYTFQLFDRIGISHVDESDEIYAYFMAYIYREIDVHILDLKEEEEKPSEEVKEKLEHDIYSRRDRYESEEAKQAYIDGILFAVATKAEYRECLGIIGHKAKEVVIG